MELLDRNGPTLARSAGTSAACPVGAVGPAGGRVGAVGVQGWLSPPPCWRWRWSAGERRRVARSRAARRLRDSGASLPGGVLAAEQFDPLGVAGEEAPAGVAGLLVAVDVLAVDGGVEVGGAGGAVDDEEHLAGGEVADQLRHGPAPGARVLVRGWLMTRNGWSSGTVRHWPAVNRSTATGMGGSPLSSTGEWARVQATPGSARTTTRWLAWSLQARTGPWRRASSMRTGSVLACQGRARYRVVRQSHRSQKTSTPKAPWWAAWISRCQIGSRASGWSARARRAARRSAVNTCSLIAGPPRRWREWRGCGGGQGACPAGQVALGEQDGGGWLDAQRRRAGDGDGGLVGEVGEGVAELASLGRI